MLLKLIVVFLGAIVLDFLVTGYTRAVSQGRRGHAACLSGMITLTNLAVWGTALYHVESMGVYGAIALAGGSSVGTFLGFKKV